MESLKPSSNSDRSSRIRSVLAAAYRRRASGEEVDERAIIATHPELMPELEGMLQSLRRVRQAQEVAERSAASAGANEGGTDELCPESIPGYLLGPMIHEGGQGIVYRAKQRSTDREVAIKVLRSGPHVFRGEQVRFAQEARILARLKHPNIVAVHDYGGARGYRYLVMDLVEGVPLDVYLREHEIDQQAKLSLFATICDAVHAAHLVGVIHRDLKPSNILVTSDGQPYVVDFGLAKLWEDEEERGDRFTVTITGQLVGSLPWLSPEQAEGNDVSLRTDVHALGLILYYMTTKTHAFSHHGSLRDQLDTIIQTEPRHPGSVADGIDDDLDTIIMKSLAKEPQRRYQSAGELAREIERYRRGDPIDAKRDSTWYLVRKTMRRHRGRVTIVAGFGALVFLSSVVAWVLYLSAATARAEAEQQRRAAEAVNSFLVDDIIAAADPTSAQGRDVSIADALDAVRVRIEQAFADTPEVEASVRVAVGKTYASLGRFTDAEEQLRQAFRIRQSVLGDTHPDTVVAGLSVINTAYKAGRWVQIRQFAAELYEACRTSLPSSDPSRLRALSALGSVWREKPTGLDLLQSAYQLQVETMGVDHVDSLATALVLSDSLWKNKASDAAEQLMRTTVEIQRKIHGDEHPKTIEASLQLATILRIQGRRQDAVELYRRVLRALQHHLGPRHPRTIDTLSSLAIALEYAADFVAAEQRYREALRARKEVLGPKHRMTIRSHYNLGDLLFRIPGKIDEGKKHLEQAIALSREVNGNGHGDTRDYMNGYAWFLLSVEPPEYRDPQRALQLALEAIRDIEPHGSFLDTLATAQYANGDLEKAVDTQRIAVDVTYLESTSLYIVHLTRLMFFLRQADNDESVRLIQSWVDRTSDEHGPAQGELIRHMVELAILLLEQDKLVLHEAFCRRELLAVWNGVPIPTSPPIASGAMAYAEDLLREDRYDLAEPLLQICLRIRDAVYPPGDPAIEAVRKLIERLPGQP